MRREEGAGQGVWLQSPAKINLSLRVLGLRTDGYHEVETWIQQVSLFDRIWVQDGGRSIRVTVSRPSVPAGRENLVHRAAAVLRARASRPLGARIHLEKGIPAGAGLGGGSGNAAAVLWILNRLWGLGLSAPALRRLGADVGSDVPFFLSSPAALCRGRGERVLRREPLRRGWILLVKPPFSLSTPIVYGWMREKLIRTGRAFTIDGRPKCPHVPVYRNDLEEVVFERYPRLRACRDELLAAGARRAMMSGTGPALFGVFPRRRDAEAAGLKFEGRARWMVRLVRPVTESLLGPGCLARAED